MELFCNGFPKSGTHALAKAAELLGLPAQVNHRPHFLGLPENASHHVLIKRDPRNVIVSWLRHNGEPVTPGKFLARFRMFQQKTLVEEMADFRPWLDSAHVVELEDLRANDRAMRGIAEYCGIPYIPGAWEELPGLTVTWNPIPSNYLDVWTPEVIAAWYAEGGGELLSAWGY